MMWYSYIYTQLCTCIYYKYAHMHIIVHRYVLNTWPIPAIVRRTHVLHLQGSHPCLQRASKGSQDDISPQDAFKRTQERKGSFWNTSSIIDTSIILETLLYNHNHSAMVLSTPVTIGALQCTWTLLDVSSLASCLSMYAKLFQFILIYCSYKPFYME